MEALNEVVSSAQRLRRRLPFLCLLLVTPLGWTADASDMLMRMNNAFSIENYDGVFSYYSGDEMASLRVVHKVIDGRQQERLVHLNGTPREILRSGDEVIYIVMPGDDLAVLENSIPTGPFARAFVRQFDRISNSYSVEAVGEGRVANRKSMRVLVKPRDQFRFGFRLWLDDATALLLRSEMIDYQGRRLEVFQFGSLLVGEGVQNAALEADQPAGSMVSHLTFKTEHALQSEHGMQPSPGGIQPSWRVGWLPPGFHMTMNDIRTKATDIAVNSMMYSDGLATFSLFFEKMPSAGAASMVAQNGATVAITRGIKNGAAAFLVTLVGEIPAATGQRIIDSVDPS